MRGWRRGGAVRSLGFALDRSLSAPALETHNSPCGLKQCVSPLWGRSGPDAPGPSRSATRPPGAVPSPPGTVTAKG